MNTCRYCGTSNALQRHYCKHCGRRIVAFCSRCGFANETDTLYCGGCGLKLTAGKSRAAKAEEKEANAPIQEHSSSFSTDELAELEKINQHRRQRLDIAGSRQSLEQEDLDKLFGKESK